MPTLTRLIIVLLAIAACIYGAMLGFVTWVRPVITELTVDLPADRVRVRARPSAEQAPDQEKDGQNQPGIPERPPS